MVKYNTGPPRRSAKKQLQISCYLSPLAMKLVLPSRRLFLYFRAPLAAAFIVSANNGVPHNTREAEIIFFSYYSLGLMIDHEQQL
jgi:hypothetical protein